VGVGMGSGICGLIAVRDALGLKTDIVGVGPDKAPASALSFAAGKTVSTRRRERSPTVWPLANPTTKRSPRSAAASHDLRR